MLDSYRTVLGRPGAPVLLGGTLVFGLGAAALYLPLVLLVAQQTGSYATAGAVSASLALGATATAPLRGRLVDRYGQTRVLVPLAFVCTACVYGLLQLALSGASAVALGPRLRPGAPPLRR